MDTVALTPTRKGVLAALALGALVLLAARFGPTGQALELGALSLVLLGISAVDLQQRIIPDALVAALFAIRGIFLLGSAALQGTAPFASSLAGAAVLGLGTFAISLVADSLWGRESLGGGDIKLLAAVGFCFGVEKGLAVLFGACLIALAASLGRRGGDGTFPFGPAIAAASFLAMLLP